MATTANIPPGAVSTNGTADPFTASPTHVQQVPVRYGAFDNDQFSLYATNSPASAKRALEAHLQDTDRRIHDASKLGSTLIQQRKDLAARLKEVEQVQSDNHVPDDLQKKLTDLEREYNEVGRDSARAFLPKSRIVSEGASDGPSILSAQSRESPSKLSAPSRRQRNQPSTRVHDIEFATEISTSLLAQVRQLQAALAEKDESLRDMTAAKAQLDTNSVNLVQRIKHMDESEQKFKDENWNLETRLQELEAGLKDTNDKHARATQALQATQAEKALKERELDDLKANHERLTDDHAMAKKVQEADLNGLKRDAATHESEKQRLYKKVDELTAQNTELAKVVSSRWKQAAAASDTDFVSADDGMQSDDMSPEHSDAPSPIKGTPARHGMLESETLRSSLNHAHKMIQNLKNNIHREKTEKIELKRMLQDARDELETRRGDTGAAANMAKKRRSEAEGVKFKKPAPRLGATRSSTTEVLEDEPDWEDENGERTPSKPRALGAAAAGGAGIAALDYARGRSDDPDTTDAFETANERENTESEAFATGAENFKDDEDGDSTETEGELQRSSTIRNVSGISNKPRDRRSMQSTASMSGDDDDAIIKTPVHNQQPKYRLRLSKNPRGASRLGELLSDSPLDKSPASSNGTPQHLRAGKSLGDELDALDDDDSMGGTPASSHVIDEYMLGGTRTPEREASARAEALSKLEPEGAEPEHEISSPVPLASSPPPTGEQAVLAHQANAAMLAHEGVTRKPEMVDAGCMTEPWLPKPVPVAEKDAEPPAEEKHTLRDRAGELVGGALAGFGLSRMLNRNKDGQDVAHDEEEAALPGADHETPPRDTALAESRPASGTVTPSRDRDMLPSVKRRSWIAATGSPASAAEEWKAVPPLPVPAPVFVPAGQSQPVELEAPMEKARDVNDTGATALETPGFPSLVDAAASGIASEPATTAKSATTDTSTVPVAAETASQSEPVQLSFSTIVALEYEPVEPPQELKTPLVPKRSSRRLDTMFNLGEPTPSERNFIGGSPATQGARAESSMDGAPPAPPSIVRTRSKSMPGSQRSSRFKDDLTDRSIIEPKVLVGAKGQNNIPTLTFGSDDDSDDMMEAMRAPLADVSPNVNRGEGQRSRDSVLPVTKPLQISKPMADEGSQTMVSGSEIESMLRNKNTTLAVAPSSRDVGSSPMKSTTASTAAAATAAIAASLAQNRRSTDSIQLGSPRRPLSAGSARGKGPLMAPPLPPDHTQKIAAAQGGPSAAPSSAGAMGPPMIPASAYGRYMRPKTPTDRPLERGASRDGTTPRAIRHRDSRSQMAAIPAGRVSQRTSMSSFASELDDRLDMNWKEPYEPPTDPRMIAAITQTMIGEYLWKYTRKAGTGHREVSHTRHRRFFWVHPYTRSLYWSEQDPSTAGKNMFKSKSVAINSVRVVSDDNAFPPGLHRKSLVVITPGREIVFTAPTGQRHETWFNALSYLLLRTGQEKAEAGDGFDEDDLEEFNPGFGRAVRRSISKMTTRSSARSRSRVSLSSYNSRTTARSRSPRGVEVPNSLAQRAAADRKAPQLVPAAKAAAEKPQRASVSSRAGGQSREGATSSMAGRFSSMAGRFRPSSRASRRDGRMSAMSGATDPASVYDAHPVVGTSAEDLRAVIEQQEREAARLENVRSCCDGKHDVGSLSRTGRHSAMSGKYASHGHGHSHAHPPPAESSRSRRGE